MTFKEFKILIKNNLKVLVIVIIIFTIFSLIYSFYNLTLKKGEFYIYINKVGTDTTDNFKYDQYYSISTIEKLTQDLRITLNNKKFISPIFENLDEKYTRNKFQLSQIATGVFYIKILGKNEKFLKKFSENLTDKLNNTITTLFSDTDPVIYRISSSETSISKNSANFFFNFIIFNFFGIIAFLILLLLKLIIAEKE